MFGIGIERERDLPIHLHSVGIISHLSALKINSRHCPPKRNQFSITAIDDASILVPGNDGLEK